MTNDRITNEDKAEYLRNERKLKRKGDASGASSYHQQAIIDLGLENSTGRFASKPVVTGQTKAVEYPAASSPWSAQANPGIEPSLGYSVNDMDVTGEAHEQAIGEPETGAMAQSTHPSLRTHRKFPESAFEVSGSPPPLAEVDAPADCQSAVPSAGTSSLRETPRSTPFDVPDDGLPDDVERRSDGWPLSTSHTLKKRKIG